MLRLFDNCLRILLNVIFIHLRTTVNLSANNKYLEIKPETHKAE